MKILKKFSYLLGEVLESTEYVVLHYVHLILNPPPSLPPKQNNNFPCRKFEVGNLSLETPIASVGK